MFGGDGADAVEEFIALASESLSLFDADSNGKITTFCGNNMINNYKSG